MKDRPEDTHNNQDLGEGGAHALAILWGENRFHFCEAKEQSRYLHQKFGNDDNNLPEDSPFFPTRVEKPSKQLFFYLTVVDDQKKEHSTSTCASLSSSFFLTELLPSGSFSLGSSPRA